MPRFNQKRWRPAHDSSPGYRAGFNPHCVVLHIALREDTDNSDGRHHEIDVIGCPCGCGEWPTGNRSVFRMGHDARLRGKLIRAHLSATKIVEVYGDREPNEPTTAIEIAKRHAVIGKPFTWVKFLEDAVEKREGRNREVLQRALGSKRLITVGRWEYTGQVAAVYRVDGEDYYEVEYVTKAGQIKKARVPAAEAMPALEID